MPAPWPLEPVMRQTLRLSKAIWGVAIVLVLIAPTASADTAAVEDAQDTNDVMDLASASHGHSESLPGVLVHTLTTFEKWTYDEFVGAQVRIWLPDGDKGYDRIIVIARDDSRQTLRGLVYGNPSGRLRSFAEVYQSDDRTVVAELPATALARRVDSYKWKAFLSYPCDRTGSIPCSPPPPDTHPGRIPHELESE